MGKQRKFKVRAVPTGRLRRISRPMPPGIVVDRYEVTDLREYDITTDYGSKTHSVEVWTTLRDRLIDRWLDAERILRTACVVLLSPTEAVRPRVWTLMNRQGGDSLIELVADLLVAQGHSLPPDFRASLKGLAATRNLLAHLASRPRENKLSNGLVFLKSTGFKEGVYVEVSYEDIEKAMADVQPVMTWLVAEIPESDGVAVQMEDEVFDLLDARSKPSE